MSGWNLEKIMKKSNLLHRIRRRGWYRSIPVYTEIWRLSPAGRLSLMISLCQLTRSVKKECVMSQGTVSQGSIISIWHTALPLLWSLGLQPQEVHKCHTNAVLYIPTITSFHQKYPSTGVLTSTTPSCTPTPSTIGALADANRFRIRGVQR